jgi:hypothetical protein
LRICGNTVQILPQGNHPQSLKESEPDSVLGPGFERMEIGIEVRFAEEAGDAGPQASTVHIVKIHENHDLRECKT